jgi:hypothetical protein
MWLHINSHISAGSEHITQCSCIEWPAPIKFRFRNMRPGSVVPLRSYASFDPGTKNRAPRSPHDDLAVTCAICASCVVRHPRRATEREHIAAGTKNTRSSQGAAAPTTSRRPARRALPAPSDQTRAHRAQRALCYHCYVVYFPLVCPLLALFCITIDT